MTNSKSQYLETLIKKKERELEVLKAYCDGMTIEVISPNGVNRVKANSDHDSMIFSFDLYEYRVVIEADSKLWECFPEMKCIAKDAHDSWCGFTTHDIYVDQRCWRRMKESHSIISLTHVNLEFFPKVDWKNSKIDRPKGI